MIAPRSRRVASAGLLSLLGVMYAGSLIAGAPVAAAGAPWRPAPGTTWQWQLSGTVDTSVDAEVYDIDLFDTPQETIDALHFAGRRVVCYFSGGSSEVRRPDSGNFPRRVLGSPLDPPYASERWLDVRSPALRPIMQARLDLAGGKHCDGVEPDNLDGYEHKTGFKLKARHQRAYNRFLADQAHERGLAVGLKNDANQVTALEPRFDFAVVEQCFQFEECKKYKPFIDSGKAVFAAEYKSDPAEFCPAAAQLRFSAILKRLDAGVSRVACPPGG